MIPRQLLLPPAWALVLALFAGFAGIPSAHAQNAGNSCANPTVSGSTITFGDGNCWYQLQNLDKQQWDVCQGAGDEIRCPTLDIGDNYRVKRFYSNPWQELVPFEFAATAVNLTCANPTVSGTSVSFGDGSCWYQLQNLSKQQWNVCNGTGDEISCPALVAGDAYRAKRFTSNPWNELAPFTFDVPSSAGTPVAAECEAPTVAGTTIAFGDRSCWYQLQNLSRQQWDVCNGAGNEISCPALIVGDRYRSKRFTLNPWTEVAAVEFDVDGTTPGGDPTPGGNNASIPAACLPSANASTGAPVVCNADDESGRMVLAWATWEDRSNGAQYTVTPKTNGQPEDHSLTSYLQPDNVEPVATVTDGSDHYVFPAGTVGSTYILENTSTGAAFNVMVGCDPTRKVIEFAPHQGGYQGWCIPGAGLSNRIYSPPSWSGNGFVSLGEPGDGFVLDWTNTGSNTGGHTEFDISVSRSQPGEGYGSLSIANIDSANALQTAVGRWSEAPIGKTHVQSIIWINREQNSEKKADAANCGTSFENLTNAQIEARQSIDVTITQWSDASIRQAYFSDILPERTTEVSVDNFPEYRFFRRFPGDLCERASYFIIGNDVNGNGGNNFSETSALVEIDTKAMLEAIIDAEVTAFSNAPSVPIVGNNSYTGDEALFTDDWYISSMGWEGAGANADAVVTSVGNSSGRFELGCYSVPTLDGSRPGEDGARACTRNDID